MRCFPRFRVVAGLTLPLAFFVATGPRSQAALEVGPFLSSFSPPPKNARAKQTPRVSTLLTDGWARSLQDGSFRPVDELRPSCSWRQRFQEWRHRGDSDWDGLCQGHFLVETYLDQIQILQRNYGRQRDVLMYYGGISARPRRHGLNFNAWSRDDLARLRLLGCRPFVGLETFDPNAINALARRLHQAGYGPQERIYVRIGSEPSTEAYGKHDFRRHFVEAAGRLHELNQRYRLNIHTVFAGTNRADFERYNPPAWAFDAIGFDLYVTPENAPAQLALLRTLAHRFAKKPLVLPEWGIATAGPAHSWLHPFARRADPLWAQNCLAEILTQLAQHPGGVEQATAFSVNVAARLPDKRWNWAWTPRMLGMLKEWQAAPRQWRAGGFHLYDPQSYPVGQTFVFIRQENFKLAYRKLRAATPDRPALFQEITYHRSGETWTHNSRVISLVPDSRR